ncbi:MAG: GLPGLI family protein [Chlorobi bacterium]|nr:GLPGLI family protein [Chlorobiota bacterium]
MELADNEAFNKEAMLKRRDKDFELFVNDSCVLFKGADKEFFRHNKKKILLKTFIWYDRKNDMKEKIVVSYPYFMPTWTIYPEILEWKDYKVYKALYKDRKTVAWFSPDIPLDGGPEFFHGLPGAIVKLEKPNGIVYTLVSIKKEKKPFGRPQGDRYMTRKEFSAFLEAHGVAVPGN